MRLRRTCTNLLIVLIPAILVGRASAEPSSRREAVQHFHFPWVQLGIKRTDNNVYMVKCLQYLLRDAGYQGIAVDGKFGKQTRWYVMQFQRAHGLKVDGYVGGQTWKKLIRPVQLGDSGDVVRAVQLMVGDKLPIDGKFGPATREAVIAYQKDYNEHFVAKAAWRLEEDGIVGPLTWNALLSSYDD